MFNGGGAALSLSNLSVPAGYTLVAGFGTTTVQPGSSTSLSCRRTRRRWARSAGTVTFTTNDSASKDSFSFPVTGTVSNVAPTATISNSGPVAQGSPVTVSLGNPYDPVERGHGAGFRYNFALHRGGAIHDYATAGTISFGHVHFRHLRHATVWGRIIDENGLYTDYSTQVTVKSTALIIDDGDPPRWTTTGTWTNCTGQGYDSDVDQATPVTSANGVATATWTFTALNPNQYYRVETTWTKNANRATNAPYTISGGAATLPVAVNQQQAPVGVSGDNWTWQELGVYQPTTGTLVVTLSNSGANGNVIADAVRIEPVPAGWAGDHGASGDGQCVRPGGAPHALRQPCRRS